MSNLRYQREFPIEAGALLMPKIGLALYQRNDRAASDLAEDWSASTVFLLACVPGKFCTAVQFISIAVS